MRRSTTVLLTAALAALVVGGLAGFAWGVQSVRARWWPYATLVALRDGGRAAPPETPGRWRLMDGRRPWLSEDDRAYTAAQLEALGYAEGTLPPVSAPGVQIRSDDAFPGLSLVTSGHAPEATLIDLDGRVVHRWEASHATVFPDQAAAGRSPRPYWRRARLLSDGGLVAMFVDHGAFRLDREGRVVWRWEGGGAPRPRHRRWQGLAAHPEPAPARGA